MEGKLDKHALAKIVSGLPVITVNKDYFFRYFTIIYYNKLVANGTFLSDVPVEDLRPDINEIVVSHALLQYLKRTKYAVYN